MALAQLMGWAVMGPHGITTAPARPDYLLLSKPVPTGAERSGAGRGGRGGQNRGADKEERPFKSDAASGGEALSRQPTAADRR